MHLDKYEYSSSDTFLDFEVFAMVLVGIFVFGQIVMVLWNAVMPMIFHPAAVEEFTGLKNPLPPPVT